MAAAPEGSLARWPVEQVLGRLVAGRQTGRLVLIDRDLQGTIEVREGKVVHAATGRQEGDDAFMALLGWQDGIFRFEAGALGGRTTVSPDIVARMHDARRDAAEREAVRKAIPPERAVPVLLARAPSGPVTIQPEEWQFIARIDGVKTVAEIARDLGTDPIELGRLIFGLLGEGLVDVRLPVSRRQDAPLVTPAFFQELERRAAAALGPIAPVVVDDAIEALGATRQTLTQLLASALVELVATEISDDQRRTAFQRSMLEALRSRRAA